jgi:hypothetical protein
MTAIALQLPSGRPNLGRGIFRLAKDLISGFREAWDISYRYEQLSQLSDDALRARNIKREDLPRIALTGEA